MQEEDYFESAQNTKYYDELKTPVENIVEENSLATEEKGDFVGAIGEAEPQAGGNSDS